MITKNYKIKFRNISYGNRWLRSKWNRNGDWVIIGIQKWYAGPEDFCYGFYLLGLELRVWFKREFKK